MDRSNATTPPEAASRRRWLHNVAAVLSVTIAAFASCAAVAQPAAQLRIGYQKSASLLVLLKSRQTLEQRLAPLGLKVRWVEFPAGPQLLEGLNVGSVDLGYVGEAPPIFAQAAGADFVYVGHDPAAPQAEAILVPKDSPLRTVADLKGKKIALNKGSNVHYLLVRLLEEHGLNYRDVQPVFLAPADARAAFERGSVDAWAIWDPFLAAAEKQVDARVLADGTGVVKNYAYYLAARRFAEQHQEAIAVLFEELAAQGRWLKAHPKEAAQLIAPLQGLDPEVVERSLSRYSFGVVPVSPEVAAEQQRIADVFLDLKLIPRPIRIVDALPRTATASAR